MTLTINESKAKATHSLTNMYNHPKIMEASLNKCAINLYRQAAILFPHEKIPTKDFTIEDQGLGYFWSSDLIRSRFVLRHLTLETADVADLNHPDTVISPSHAFLTLVEEVTIMRHKVNVHLMIQIPLTDEDKQTLRACGAMYEETEEYHPPQTHTVVQCKI